MTVTTNAKSKCQDSSEKQKKNSFESTSRDIPHGEWFSSLIKLATFRIMGNVVLALEKNKKKKR